MRNLNHMPCPRVAIIALALAAGLALSCAGPQPVSVTPTPIPPPTQASAPSPQTKIEATPSPKESLVIGKPEWIVSSPEPDKGINIQFVLDASGSMLQKAGDRSRADIARDVIGRLSAEIPPGINLGLIAYGHRYPDSNKTRSCSDIEVLSPLGSDAPQLVQRLGTIKSLGWTPIGGALDHAGASMASQTQNINNIVLLSDGKETCEGKPIEVAQRLKEGPAKITVHTIGFAIDEDARKELTEIASVSGGSYNEADDAQGLLQAVDSALRSARSGTFFRVEIAGDGGRRVGLPVQLAEPASGKKLHEFRGWVDSPMAPGSYDVLVGTAPRVVFRSVQISPHTRTVIRFPAGGIRVDLADSRGSAIKALVHLRSQETGAVLRDFTTWYNQPVLPGVYDIAVDSNPPVTRRNVSVAAQGLSTVDLRSGTIRTDAVGLGGERPNWELALTDESTGEVLYRSIAGRDLMVWAGDYRLDVLSKPKISMTVKIDPGEVKTVKLETGLLRVELLDGQGRRANVPVSLVDSAGKPAGTIATWEETYPMPGPYQLVIGSQPPFTQPVQVSPSQPTIVKLRTP